jgi:hypothetical protein
MYVIDGRECLYIHVHSQVLLWRHSSATHSDGESDNGALYSHTYVPGAPLLYLLYYTSLPLPPSIPTTPFSPPSNHPFLIHRAYFHSLGFGNWEVLQLLFLQAWECAMVAWDVASLDVEVELPRLYFQKSPALAKGLRANVDCCSMDHRAAAPVRMLLAARAQGACAVIGSSISVFCLIIIFAYCLQIYHTYCISIMCMDIACRQGTGCVGRGEGDLTYGCPGGYLLQMYKIHEIMVYYMCMTIRRPFRHMMRVWGWCSWQVWTSSLCASCSALLITAQGQAIPGRPQPPPPRWSRR